MSVPSSVAVGDELPGLAIPVTRQRVVQYSGASTDFNPIHFNDRSARAIGLDGVVAHGMWTMGSALRIVTDWVGDPGLVASYFTRFAHPVAVPDTDEGTIVNVAAKVTAVTDDLVTVAIEATTDGEKVLGAAKVEVRRAR